MTGEDFVKPTLILRRPRPIGFPDANATDGKIARFIDAASICKLPES
jgi:hypothetical protein